MKNMQYLNGDVLHWRRIFIMLFGFLCLSANTWAGTFSNYKTYTIRNAGTAGVYLYYDGTNSYAAAATDTEDDANRQWAIFTFKGKTYLYNVGAGMFLHGITGTKSSYSWPLANTSIHPITIDDSNAGYSLLRDAACTGTQDYLHYKTGYTYNTTNWGTSTVNSHWILEETATALTDAQSKAIAKAVVSDSILQHPGTLGYLNATAYEAMSKAVDDATNADDIIAAYNTYVTDENIVKPQAGKYYYLKNALYPTFYAGQNTSTDYTYLGTIANDTLATTSQIWFYDGNTLIGATGQRIMINGTAQSLVKFAPGYDDFCTGETSMAYYAYGTFYVNGMNLTKSTANLVDTSKKYSAKTNPYHTVGNATETAYASHWIVSEVPSDNLPAMADTLWRWSNKACPNRYLQPVLYATNDSAVVGSSDITHTQAIWRLVIDGANYKMYNPYYGMYLRMTNDSVKMVNNYSNATAFSITKQAGQTAYTFTANGKALSLNKNYTSVAANSANAGDSCYWNAIAFAVGEDLCTTLSDYATKILQKATTGGGLFEMASDEVKAEAEKANAEIQSDQSEVSYIALDKAIYDYSSYNMPGEGRYYIKNCNTYDVVGKYLTNYGALVSTTSPNYYSIWDITYNTDGTYIFMNEGAAYVHQPRTDRGANGQCQPGNAYLTYESTDISYDSYKMGAKADAARIVFIPQGDGTAEMRATTDNYLATLAIYPEYDWTSAPLNSDGAHYDETLQSGITGKDNQYWQLAQFTAAEESSLFNTNARTNRVGYVGGPITMSNIEAAPSLKQLDAMMTSDSLAIKAQGDEATKAIATGAANGAMFRAIMDYMSNEDKAKSTTTIPTGINPEYRLSLSEGKVFYIQNLSRPAEMARLTGTSDATHPWQTVETTDESYNTSAAQFTLEATGNTGSVTYYLKNVETNEYICKESLGDNMVATTDKNSAAQVQIEEVVPGIYLVYDASCTNGYKYMTVGGYDVNYNKLCYYNNVELSTMWKIYSLNEVKTSKPKSMGEGITINGVVYTYFYPYTYELNTQLDTIQDKGESKGILVYYGLNARYESGRLRVTLRQVRSIDETFYMQGGCGYAILTTEDSPFNSSKDIKTSSIEITASNDYKDAYIKNIDVLQPGTNCLITPSNWMKYYVLDYASRDSVIGTWNSKPIYGTGLGFYQPEVNTVISSNMVYIPESAFGTIDWSSYNPNTAGSGPASVREIQESGMGWEAVFEDEEGNLTGIADVDAQGRFHLRESIYDLSGRQLSAPKHGINIINGHKVFVK